METADMVDLMMEADDAFESGTMDLDELSRCLAAVLVNTDVRDDIHAVIHAHAHGAGNVVVNVLPEELTPNEAAAALGVSRKLVMTLMTSGDLRFRVLPGSTHRRIPAEDVMKIVDEQAYIREGVDGIMDALSDAAY